MEQVKNDTETQAPEKESSFGTVVFVVLFVLPLVAMIAVASLGFATANSMAGPW